MLTRLRAPNVSTDTGLQQWTDLKRPIVSFREVLLYFQGPQDLVVRRILWT